MRTEAETRAPRTILVLSGGGMKGMAHIGVWRALADAGITPDAVIGTSIGSLVGAILCSGVDIATAEHLACSITKEDVVRINRRVWWLGGVRQTGVFSGEHFAGLIARVLPIQDYADLKIPLRMNAVALETGEEVWFGTSAETRLPLREAIRASCALPVYFPPVIWGGRHLSDGAMRNVAGVDHALSWHAERIIVSDVSADLTPATPTWKAMGLVGVHERTLSILGAELLRRERLRWSDLGVIHIRPAVGHFDTFDFSHTEAMIREGEMAGRQAIATHLDKSLTDEATTASRISTLLRQIATAGRSLTRRERL